MVVTTASLLTKMASIEDYPARNNEVNRWLSNVELTTYLVGELSRTLSNCWSTACFYIDAHDR